MKAKTYKVESDIPAPKKRRTTLSIVDMQPGESFLFPIEQRNRYQSHASILKKNKGRVYTIKVEGVGLARIWRIK